MDTVKKYLEQIKSSGNFDDDYLNGLITSLDSSIKDYSASEEIIKIIEKRYAESKKHNA